MAGRGPRRARPSTKRKHPFFREGSWRDQYDRFVRALDRANPDEVNGVDYEDAVMTACIYAWSLADWLRLEREVQARFATKREWHQHLARTQRRLRQVRDVANGAKHRLLDDHHVEGQRTSVLNEVFREDDWPRTFVMYEFRHPGEPPERIEGLALAHLARRAWDDVLADLGLLTRSTREGEV